VALHSPRPVATSDAHAQPPSFFAMSKVSAGSYKRCHRRRRRLLLLLHFPHLLHPKRRPSMYTLKLDASALSSRIRRRRSQDPYSAKALLVAAGGRRRRRRGVTAVVPRFHFFYFLCSCGCVVRRKRVFIREGGKRERAPLARSTGRGTWWGPCGSDGVGPTGWALGVNGVNW
jgi:hypothetical protein